MYHDLTAAHERIQQLEAELAKANKLLARLLKGKWLAKLFGYKVYVDCEHSHYCQSFETMASGIASGKVKVYRRSSSRYCGPHPALVTNDARYEHCRICGARFGQCEHIKLDNSDLDGLLTQAARGPTLWDSLRAWDEGTTLEERLGGGQSNKALMELMKHAEQVAKEHPGTMKVMVVEDE